jgi:hypothetical protein
MRLEIPANEIIVFWTLFIAGFVQLKFSASHVSLDRRTDWMQSVPSCLRVKLGWRELKNHTFNSASLTQFAFLAGLRFLVSYASLLFASGIGRNLMFCVILEWCRRKSIWFDLRVNGRKLTTRASAIVRWNQQIHSAFCCFSSCTRTCWVFDSKRFSMQNAEKFQQENQSWIVDLQTTIIETDS